MTQLVCALATLQLLDVVTPKFPQIWSGCAEPTILNGPSWAVCGRIARGWSNVEMLAGSVSTLLPQTVLRPHLQVEKGRVQSEATELN